MVQRRYIIFHLFDVIELREASISQSVKDPESYHLIALYHHVNYIEGYSNLCSGMLD